MFNLCYYGHPVLRKKADPIAVFDNSVKQLAVQMIETMRASDGVGLAAPQVGRSLQCVVVDPSKDASHAVVLINPEFTYKSEDMVVHEEGCLSFPDLHVDIPRHKTVSVKAFDENGKTFVIENAEDFLSRVLQHEIDHINGLFIIDHISLLKRKLLKSKLKKISELNNEEITNSDTSPSA
jgi:peptide deformylase